VGVRNRNYDEQLHTGKIETAVDYIDTVRAYRCILTETRREIIVLD